MRPVINPETIEFISDFFTVWYNTPYDYVSFDYNTKEFIIIELIPTPHYDSGGGIDCCDFIEKKHTIPFEKAFVLCNKASFNAPEDDATPVVYNSVNTEEEVEILPF